ncbi:hypothetical protein [Burkholderia stabilis]|nr:hypothetical protein [Burkholderia stabilis]
MTKKVRNAREESPRIIRHRGLARERGRLRRAVVKDCERFVSK